MHQFLIANNPNAPHSSGIWIIKIPKPIAIIEVVHDGMSDVIKEPIHSATFTTNNGELIKFNLYHYFMEGVVGFDTHEQIKKEVDTLFNRAWHWYKAFLEKHRD